MVYIYSIVGAIVYLLIAGLVMELQRPVCEEQCPTGKSCDCYIPRGLFWPIVLPSLLGKGLVQHIRTKQLAKKESKTEFVLCSECKEKLHERPYR